MGYFYTSSDISGSRGKFGYALGFGGNVLFSQIFSGTPQHYPGSTVRFEEVLTIQTNVYDPTLVDRDLNWFDDKLYLGTARILDATSLPSSYDEDNFYLDLERKKVRRYSEYTVTANPTTPIALGERGFTDVCNFQLKNENIFIGGLLIGGSTPISNNEVFTTQQTLTKADLEDGTFNAKIKGIGLCLKPGVEGVSISYEIAAINEIRIISSAYPTFTCSLAPSNCQAEFDNFVNSNGFFFTQSAAQAALNSGAVVGYAVASDTFTCVADPNQTFTYWFVLSN